MTRQEVPPLLSLSGAVLEAQWDRVGHITLSDRCRRPVGREKKKKPRCLIFGTRTIAKNGSKNEPQAPRERGTWTSNTFVVDLLNLFSDQINF